MVFGGRESLHDALGLDTSGYVTRGSYLLEQAVSRYVTGGPPESEPVARAEKPETPRKPSKWSLQTHCKRGHALIPENLWNRPGRRSCRLCDRERYASPEYRAARRERYANKVASPVCRAKE